MSRALKPTAEDLERITAATRSAEKKTSAEIVTAIVSQSGIYGAQVLTASLLAVLAASLLFIVFLPAVTGLLRSVLWEAKTLPLLLAFAAVQVLVFWIFFGVLSLLSSLKSLVIPRRDKAAKVRERAESAFFRHGIAATAGSNGVLIFVSLFEKRVELVTDSAVSEKVGAGTWPDVIDKLVAGIKGGRFIEALAEQVGRCGDILSGPFPYRPGDVNELGDRPIVE